jgi:hypothetical protein
MKIYRIISIIVAALVLLLTLTMLVNAIVDQPTTEGEAFGWGLGNIVIWILCMIASILPFVMGVIGFILTMVKQPRGTRLWGIVTYACVALLPALTGLAYLLVLKLLTI